MELEQTMSNFYVVDDNAQLFSIDTTSLAATKVGNTSVVMTDIAFSPNGKLYGISFSDLYEIDTKTGASTKIGSLGVSGANALGIDKDGRAFLASSDNANLYAVNLTTGLATSIGRNQQNHWSAGDISFHGSDAYIATVDRTVAKLNLATGAIISEKAVDISNLYGLAELNGITYGVAGKTLYAIDVDTGKFQALRTFSGTGFNAFNGAATDDFGVKPFNQTLSTALSNILRADSSSSANAEFLSGLVAKVDQGTLTQFAAIQQVVQKADGSTTVATLSYQFFTGKTPSYAGIDFLISSIGPNRTNLNSAYYAKFDTVNRYINFSVNLGKNGEAKDSFAASYGSLSLFDATKKAYAAIFGGTPTDDKIHNLIDTRVDYLAYYGGDGATGIGTKAAMVGFLLAAAATENLGVMSKSNDAWLIDIADGVAPYAVNILDPANGYYKADYIFGG